MPHTSSPTLADVVNMAAQLTLADQAQLLATVSRQIAQALAVHGAQTAGAVTLAATPQLAVMKENTMPWSGPLVLREAPAPTPTGDMISNGLDPATGQPLLTIDLVAARRLAAETLESKDRTDIHRERKQGEAPSAGLVHGFNEDKLDQAGWAIVVSSKDQAVLLKALSPLIIWRCQQQGLPIPDLTFRDGEDCGAWLARQTDRSESPMKARQRIPVLLYHPGETCIRWLARHATWPAAVDPQRGVPFYLMLTGRPGPLSSNDEAYIPFDFQYDLDIFWGVGRLCFSDLNGYHRLERYAAYAEQVVAFEQRTVAPYQKRVHFFGTKHPMDRSTRESAEQLITPLHIGFDGKGGVAQRLGFEPTLNLGASATKTTLGNLLKAGDDTRPALLMSATHGIGMPVDDPQLPARQGALVCADWNGIGSVDILNHCFSASDLPQHINVTGLLAICFACYSVGCPSTIEVNQKPFEPAIRISPRALISQLPQDLLTCGALAVLGHVDKALSTIFNDDVTKVVSQTQSLDDVLGRLLDGKRIGYATDQFNLYQALLGVQLSEVLMKYEFARAGNPDFGVDTIGRLWAARMNARNFLLLGDPAVRLPFGPAA